MIQDITFHLIRCPLNIHKFETSYTNPKLLSLMLIPYLYYRSDSGRRRGYVSRVQGENRGRKEAERVASDAGQEQGEAVRDQGGPEEGTTKSGKGTFKLKEERLLQLQTGEKDYVFFVVQILGCVYTAAKFKGLGLGLIF